MTPGERWLSKAHARLMGYCRTRGWLCGELRLTSERRDQYEVFIADRFGRTASLAFEMAADVPSFVDDKGILHDFNAQMFLEFVGPFELAPKAVVSKRQLVLSL